MMTKPPVWYHAIAGLATFWALVGCYAYLSQVSMGPEAMAQLPPAQREIWAMTPSWVIAAYAIAVWVGLAGAIGLLLRLSFARIAYVVSLVAIVVQFGWTFAATPILTTVGTSAVFFPLFIAAVCAALVWFAGHAAGRGWLR
jgi:hypothetical protein